MNQKVWIAVACVLVGAPVAAYGLANSSLLLALAGLALVLVFVYLIVGTIAAANQPKRDIPKSADAAWNMKDRPVDSTRPDERSK